MGPSAHKSSLTAEPRNASSTGDRGVVTRGALRAAYLIGSMIAGKPNHPSFWTTATYDELAALIDHETAATEMLDALRQWKYAQENRDAVEMVNAQISRDLAIAAAVGDRPASATGEV